MRLWPLLAVVVVTMAAARLGEAQLSPSSLYYMRLLYAATLKHAATVDPRLPPFPVHRFPIPVGTTPDSLPLPPMPSRFRVDHQNIPAKKHNGAKFAASQDQQNGQTRRVPPQRIGKANVGSGKRNDEGASPEIPVVSASSVLGSVPLVPMQPEDTPPIGRTARNSSTARNSRTAQANMVVSCLQRGVWMCRKRMA